ncbi:S8 family serine peptidase [Vibrio nigripulchritudo]|uniref:S8 family serine peptidase n=1 Tax=Vibrio nigripulchritudo TaxID=28173 RepID=UPI0003B23C27|nr:S8 family serine peptidase [Vibrio nigripulchritudo]CCN72502.1 Microbial serine proteinase [Vibrio nigripulchritudo SFn118]
MHKKRIISLAIGAAIAYAGTAGATDRFHADRWLTPGDPLLQHQWNLLNTGQAAFAAQGGVAGHDLNLWQTHLFGYGGQGVIVAVVDDGLEIAHPDLAPNIKPGSWNLVTNTNDPTPTKASASHGTSVAGIIAAAGGNNEGVRGVAPQAGLKGYNYLDEQSIESWLITHGKDPRTADVRVFNQSYGSQPLFSIPYDLTNNLNLAVQDAVHQEVSTTAHQSKGALFVKSAGNGFGRTSVRFTSGATFRILPKDYDTAEVPNEGLPWQNSNLSYNNANYWNMTVSAMNADGKLSSYSSVGSNVFLTAPAGEFGRDKPAHVTTDLMGCDRGYNTIERADRNGLHGGTADDPNCNYNGVMNGTSSSAPNTSGAAALLMSVRPDLSQRDIRHLLATTATKIDAEHVNTDISYTTSSGVSRTVTGLEGWSANAAGYDYSPYYGFGLIDVDKAMFAARTAQPLPPLQLTEWKTTTANITVPDAGDQAVTDTVAINDALKVESVQVKVDIDHERTSDLLIELVSPSGTSSVLMSPRNSLVGRSLLQGIGQAIGDESRGYRDHLLLSHKFYGEDAAGEWTLRVTDTSGEHSHWILRNRNDETQSFNIPHFNNSVPGTINHWSIRIIGHQG